MTVSRRRIFGPGLLVTAAFIGPGTVTTASRAGAGFGFAIAWALVFAVLATVVLQEMSARLGLVTREGLGEALRTTFSSRLLRTLAALLVVSAIAFGNAAFEMGNIAGAGLGLEALTNISHRVWALAVGLGACAVLACGVYRIIERLLIAMVVVMSLVFVTTAIIVRPHFGDVLRGMFIPTLPPASLTTVIALIGTTVVPYNLFLHASAVRERWSASLPVSDALREARLDTGLSVTLGGLVTLAILVTAASCYPAGTQLESAVAMAEQLEPLLGVAAKTFFAIGLLAAGLTSAITAPLAAAYATAGALGWRSDLRSWKFRATWALIVVSGTTLALAGYKPVHAIVFAQAANGLLLPIMAVFLLLVVNRVDLLGKHANSLRANILGIAVVATAAGLGIFKLVNSLSG
ncbi:MAG: Nramp family divalent metal transporter [Planctomycetota bacterium]|jgi:manganese transport protein